jgi:CBS-domain-containing membrane protein
MLAEDPALRCPSSRLWVQDVEPEVGRILVRDAMTRNVVTVTPAATLKVAAGLLAEHAITSMPVVDDTGCLIGVVSEADVVRESSSSTTAPTCSSSLSPRRPPRRASLR